MDRLFIPWRHVGGMDHAYTFHPFTERTDTFTNQQSGRLMYASIYGVVYQAYGLDASAGVCINIFIIAAICAAFGLGLSFMIKEEILAKAMSVT